MAADAPHPWTTLHEDAKSYISLSTALLGVTATFADRLLSDDTLGRVVVILGWLVLVTSILCAVTANGKIFAGLSSSPLGAAYGRTGFWMNASVYALVGGTALLAFGAWRTSIADDADDTPSPAALARTAVAEMTGIDAMELTVESLEKNVGNDFTLLVTTEAPAQRFEVVVDGDRGEVVSAQVDP